MATVVIRAFGAEATAENGEWSCPGSAKFEATLNETCNGWVAMHGRGYMPDVETAMARLAVQTYGAEIVSVALPEPPTDIVGVQY